MQRAAYMDVSYLGTLSREWIQGAKPSLYELKIKIIKLGKN